MKKIKMNAAKLQLNKEKISSLTDEKMTQLKGGSLNATMTVINCPTYADHFTPCQPDLSGACVTFPGKSGC